MDLFAITSIGVWPQTVTDQEYAAYFCSWGLLEELFQGEVPEEVRQIFRRYFSMLQIYKQYPRKYTV